MGQLLPYGMWHGKIDTEFVAQRGRVNSLRFDPKGDALAFSVSKGGLSSLYVKTPKRAPRKINGDLPVYGGLCYGGGDFDLYNGKIVFNAGAKGLFLYDMARRPDSMSPLMSLTRDTLDRAAPIIHPDGEFIAFLTSDGKDDYIAFLHICGDCWPEQWVDGADFYMQPEFSPDGEHLAWAEWDHPNMPWTGSVVKMARFAGGDGTEWTDVSGDPDKPSSQPHFSPDGRKLAFIETDEEWENIIVYDLETKKYSVAVKGEGFSLAPAAFIQDVRTFAWFPDGKRIAYLRISGTVSEVWVKDLESGEDRKVSDDRFTSFDQLVVSPEGIIGVIAAGPLEFSQVILIDPACPEAYEVVYRVSDELLDGSFISVPQEISWSARNGDTVHALYYPPCSPDHSWTGAPPAIVQIHGGPTGKADRSFSAETAYFCSLGYAYIRLNYRGSTGYGRRYIESLNGHWGEYDTEDAVTCAEYLAANGLADPKRLLITGGSSGGYCVLNVLTQYPDVYTAGADLYGVSNLYGLLADTDKLELHYTESLVGTLPEAREKYDAWSPLFHAENIRVPLAVFQGDRDPVVPKEQSEQIVSKLRAPHVFKLYEGEGHGFRQPEHIRDYLETLHAFLLQYV